MSLSSEQTLTVSQWVKDGATLSEVQKRILEEFKLSMTYMDVRFLVDDLDLTLVDHAPKADASDVSKTPPPPPKPKAPAPAAPGATDQDLPAEDAEAFPVGTVTLDVDNVTLIPGAIASGSVTFSDGVTGKWIVDHQGRPGFTEVSQDGYQPSPEDAQMFMQELSAALRAKGMG
ncbi:hypothetical protein [Synoicihabitans lomoniglobus]|uniref:Uncharacterized protein n=1 Tax=Synoicihabitans lomoniglobus TaxID=2909285 RepID=A0AAE9ZQY8_9BACT|nr:hypothetical protein [Opitutaceae bacterium LMO-M01]WED63540.1 hypothetical protein PXH66_14475 [Opitutaceae bacterium LMO-M01]